MGRPRTIHDLKNHNCIGFRLPSAGRRYRWELQEAGRDFAIEVKGTIVVNDSLLARGLALAGVGLAHPFDSLVRGDIAAGRLGKVLPETSLEEQGLLLYFPRCAAGAPKRRAFIAAARALLKSRGSIDRTAGFNDVTS